MSETDGWVAVFRIIKKPLVNASESTVEGKERGGAEMEGWSEGWRDGGMEGGMEGLRDGGMEGGMEGGRDGGMEGGMEGWEG